MTATYYWGAYALKIAWTDLTDFSGTYDDVSKDVIGPIRWRIGFTRYLDRIAKMGSLTFMLDNGYYNNNSEAWIYSESNTGGTLYGLIKPMKLVQLTCTYSEVTYTLFKGYLDSITPVPGTSMVRVQCTDGFMPFTRSKMRQSIQTDILTSDAIDLIVNGTYIPLTAADAWVVGYSTLAENTYLKTTDVDRDVSTGLVTISYLGDTWDPERTTAYQALEDVVTAEWGYLWVSRAGAITFRDRQWEFTDRGVDATIASGHVALDVTYDEREIINRVAVKMTPRDFITDTIVVATLQDRPKIKAGRTRKFTLECRHPTSTAKLAVNSIITPVATTDYTANANKAGSGDDKTSDISITATLQGRSIELEVTNNGSAGAWMTLLQVRSADCLVTYDKVVLTGEMADADKTEIHDFFERTDTVVLDLADDTDDGQKLADHLITLRQDPHLYVNYYGLQNSNATLYGHILNRTIGHLITITDTETGLSAKTFRLMEEDHTIDISSRTHSVRWGLWPFDPTSYWILGTDTLGVGTYLGPL